MRQFWKVNIVLLSSDYSLVIIFIEIIFKPYYFVKCLAASIAERISRKTIHFFLIEGNLLCCTKIKVTILFPNKMINYSNDWNKPLV